MIQTVKILYIPTGQFLKKYISTTAMLEILCDDVEILITRILLVNEGKFPSWVRANNIQLPLLREELEVIYNVQN